MSGDYPFPWRVPDNHTDLYQMSQVTEAQVQDGILKLLALYNVDGVPIDAGGRRQRGRMIGAAAAAGVALAGIQNVKTGSAIPAGFADIEATLAPTGVALYIEVKAPRWLDRNGRRLRAPGNVSQAQLEFLLSKYRRGAVVMVAWSVAEVEEYLSTHLKLNLEVLRKG